MVEIAHPFERLTPDSIIEAVESQGFVCDGRHFPLNSYENRVYQVGIEEQPPIIAKFYRPARWSDEQIVEEHVFCYELLGQEIPIVAPLKNADGQSLFKFSEFRFALYPRQGGRAPELDDCDHLLMLGRCLGRIHALGASRPFIYRPRLDIQSYGYDSIALIQQAFIPEELKVAYSTLTTDLMKRIESEMCAYGEICYIRTHSDCHVGNVLWRDDAPFFVDFDDTRMAPAIQDIWMLLSGDRISQQLQLSTIIEGYNEFYSFDVKQLRLIEVFRTLRMLHYAAWLARRWQDPAFPHNFPWFNTVRYWSEHILELREQLAAFDEPVLHIV